MERRAGDEGSSHFAMKKEVTDSEDFSALPAAQSQATDIHRANVPWELISQQVFNYFFQAWGNVSFSPFLCINGAHCSTCIGHHHQRSMPLKNSTSGFGSTTLPDFHSIHTMSQSRPPVALVETHTRGLLRSWKINPALFCLPPLLVLSFGGVTVGRAVKFLQS